MHCIIYRHHFSSILFQGNGGCKEKTNYLMSQWPCYPVLGLTEHTPFCQNLSPVSVLSLCVSLSLPQMSEDRQESEAALGGRFVLGRMRCRCNFERSPAFWFMSCLLINFLWSLKFLCLSLQLRPKRACVVLCWRLVHIQIKGIDSSVHWMRADIHLRYDQYAE